MSQGETCIRNVKIYTAPKSCGDQLIHRIQSKTKR